MYFDLSNINTFDFYLTLLLVAVFIVLLVLYLRGDDKYAEKESQNRYSSFAGTIREGHGGMTLFLWVVFSVILVWTVIYFILHAGEFALFFSP